jgi:hypothetical protein
MYYPYFRGKQNELILLREQAELISSSKIIPIIEPVKKNLNPLNRAITELDNYDAKYILVINPVYGDFKEDNSLIIDFIDNCKNIIIGFIITENSRINDIIIFLEKFKNSEIVIIHQGFTLGKELSRKISSYNISKHIFVNTEQNKLYQRHFKSSAQRVLIRDSFRKKTNANYPKEEHFSDLHITYEEEGMDGFGDFLIVGDEYSESGGPARAVAIHLTYLKNTDEDNMYIKHYVSERIEGVTDPGGKFLEALEKLVKDISLYEDEFNTEACKTYINLYEKEHFPGLGYVKKLSMQHHLEIIAKFLS